MSNTRSRAAATGAAASASGGRSPTRSFRRHPPSEREQLLRDEVTTGPPPGLIAYVDGEAVGWVRVGPRTGQVRLARTRNYTSGSEEPWDDDSVWAVTCFVVRREHRREGLNARLLDAAVQHARKHGARLIEAYPIDPDAGKKKSANELFHGVVSTFADAGFREVARPATRRGRRLARAGLSAPGARRRQPGRDLRPRTIDRPHAARSRHGPSPERRSHHEGVP